MITKQYLEGIVLRTIPYQDHAKILYCYTPLGKRNIMARGVKKLNSPYRNLAQSLTRIRFVDSAKGLFNLNDASVLDTYRHIKSRMDSMAYASLCAELIYELIEQDVDHTALYMFFHETLSQMNLEKDPEIIGLIFQLKLLYVLGVAPQFRQCFSCGSTQKLIGFDLEEGSVVCQKCRKNNEIDVDLTEKIYALYTLDLATNHLPDFDDVTKAQLRQFVNRYYEFHVHYQSKALKVLETGRKAKINAKY